MLTISFLTAVCPAFLLENKRSNLSNKALGSLGRIFKPVPLVEGSGSSSPPFPFPPFPFPLFSSGLGFISSQIGLIIFFHLSPLLLFGWVFGLLGLFGSFGLLP